MTLEEAKIVMLRSCDEAERLHPGEAPPRFREAIAMLPDRMLLDQLDPLVRSLVETRLYQLVTLEAMS